MSHGCFLQTKHDYPSRHVSHPHPPFLHISTDGPVGQLVDSFSDAGRGSVNGLVLAIRVRAAAPPPAVHICTRRIVARDFLRGQRGRWEAVLVPHKREEGLNGKDRDGKKEGRKTNGGHLLIDE